MSISQEWNIDFTNKIIAHIDGDLDYDANGGTAPVARDYIRGASSGTVGQILSGTDLGGTNATGTLTLTNVTGRFEDNESLVALDSLGFDGVRNGGFNVGDTVSANAAASSIVVYAIEYNGDTGTIWGIHSGAPFVNDDVLEVGATTVADATGSEVSGAAFTGALVNEVASGGAITPPVISSIANFDNGTKAFPRFCQIQNAAAAPTATAQVQQVFGVTANGSLRLVDVTGTWADDDPIFVADNIPYDNLQTGQRFRVGDTIEGGTSGATGKVISLEVLTATTGRVILLNRNGTFQDGEQLLVNGTYVADVNDVSANFSEQHGTVTYGATAVGEIRNQLVSQGGIYGQDVSLNGLRDCNALYTYLQDTFDELGALDDEVPMSAQVKLQQYTLINDWVIPDLSFRFLESGSIQDAALANIWTNFQTLGSIAGITDFAFLPQTVQPPQIYVEQNGNVLYPWWLRGQIDVLVKVSTNTDPAIADTSDGALIDFGTVTIFAREYGTLYDHFETTTVAGVAPIPLATSTDINNATGTHIINIDNVTNLLVGEEVVDNTDETKRGVITALADDVQDTMEYIFTGTTQFGNGDTFTGQVSNQARTTQSLPTDVVAGYGDRIVIATVEGTMGIGAVAAGPLIEGELVTQAVTGASAILMDDDGAGTVTLGNFNGISFDGTNLVTGSTSGATFTPTSGTITPSSTIARDIGDGFGDQNYNAVVYMNRDNQVDGDDLLSMYEWIKYRTRSLETAGEPAYNLLGSPGDNQSGVQGRIYITLNTSYPLVKQSPFGTFAGGTFFGAQGVFIQDMANADIRNFQLADSSGTLRFPPNLQTLTVQGLVADDRVAVFRRPNSTSGSGIFTSEYTITAPAGAYNGTGDSVIRVDEAISTDTPSSGVVRLFITSTGLFKSYRYSSFVAGPPGEFTLDGTSHPGGLDEDQSGGNDAYVPLIEEEAVGSSVNTNVIYVADIPLLTRVRKKGILPFEVEGTFGSGGATVTAIRTTDTIVD